MIRIDNIFIIFFLITLHCIYINGKIENQGTVLSITSVNYDNSRVTINGTNFPANPLINVVGVRCVNAALVQSNSIVCLIQDRPNSSYDVGLALNGLTANNTAKLYTPSYGWISTIPKRVSMEKSDIIIKGSNFDTFPLFMANGANLDSTFTGVAGVYSLKLFSSLIPGEKLYYIISSNGANPYVNNILDFSLYTGLDATNVIQKGSNVTIFGNNFDLYKSIDVILDQKHLTTVCEVTYCTFTIEDDIENGKFEIKSLPEGVSSYVISNNKMWIPIIKSVSTTIVDVNKTLDTLIQFIQPSNKLEIKLDGFTLTIASLDPNSGETQLKDFPEWVGQHNLTITLKDTNETSEPYQLSYKGPQIDNSRVKLSNGNYILEVVGNYLGFNDITYPPQDYVFPLVYGITEEPISPNLDSNLNFFKGFNMKLPDSVRSGNLVVGASGKNSTVNISIRLEPSVDYISEIPAKGGAFRIVGKGIAIYSYTGQKVTRFYLDDIEKDATQLSDEYPYEIEIIAPPGIKILKIQSYDLTKYSFNVTYQHPTISSVSSTYYGIPDLITIIGTNFINTSLKVELSNSTITKDCENPIIDQNGTRIICKFSSDIFTQDSLFLNVSYEGQSIKVSKFIYYLPAQCSSCINGECINGYCKCNFGYTGVSCSRVLKPGDGTVIELPQPKNDTIGVSLGNSNIVQFNVSMNTLSEISSLDNSIVKSYKFSNIKWNLETKSDTKFNYIGKFDSDTKLVVNVETTIFKNNTDFNFEGDIFQVLNNSVKYIITISNWTFSNQLNKLELDFISKTDASKCGEKKTQINSSVNSKKSMRTMEIVHNGMILNAFFSDRMLVDGRLVYSSVSDPIEDTEENTFFVRTIMTVPFFTSSCVLDPSFDALLVADDGSDLVLCKDEKKWKIPVIIVCSVVGAAILVIVGFVTYKRFKYQFKYAFQNIKLKKMSE